MEPPKDTPRRSREATIMAALDTIWREVETAMRAIQDDSRVTGIEDEKVILKSVAIIELKAHEIREALRTSGEYSSLRCPVDD